MRKLTKWFKNLKVRHVAYFIAALIFIIFTSNIVSYILFSATSQDLAMQKLAFELEQESGLLAPNLMEHYAKSERDEHIESFNAKIRTLKYGGEYELLNQWFTIPEADEEALAALEKLEESLKTYDAKFIENTEIEFKYFTAVQTNAKACSDLTVDRINSKLDNGYTFILASVIGILLIWVVTYYLIRYVLMGPIYMISKTSRRLAIGNLSEAIPITGTNEVGRIAQNINELGSTLNNATEFTREIGEGNLNVKYNTDDESKVDQDSIAGALIQMREKMKAIAEEDRNRNWTTVGLAQFADILRASNQETSTLADNIISELVQYLDANQGCIYFLNDDESDDQFLEMKGSYAFGRKKHVEDRIEIGDGVVGQAFKERKTVYMTEVPEDYIIIKSGLGDATPRCLLITPLMLNEKVHGIIEIASFNEFGDHQIEFVEKLGESIASTISNALVNRKTTLLLEETQRQTQEIMVREEEMRQNMEELMATQEEMERQEKEYISIIKDLHDQIDDLEASNN